MIELIEETNIRRAAEAFSASWRFSHNGIVSGDSLDAHDPAMMRGVLLKEKEKGNDVYTYETGRESLGIISFSARENHISKLYVNPAYLRRGIGRQLLSFAMAQMDAGRDVTVYSMNVNSRARRFYESLGFVYRGETLPFEGEQGVYLTVYVFEREKKQKNR